jgi:hypothetical protein
MLRGTAGKIEGISTRNDLSSSAGLCTDRQIRCNASETQQLAETQRPADFRHDCEQKQTLASFQSMQLRREYGKRGSNGKSNHPGDSKRVNATPYHEVPSRLWSERSTAGGGRSPKTIPRAAWFGTSPWIARRTPKTCVQTPSCPCASFITRRTLC